MADDVRFANDSEYSLTDIEDEQVLTDAIFCGEIDVSSVTDEKQTFVCAMEVMREGRLLVCDNANKKIKLLDDDSEILHEVVLTSEPHGMAALSPSFAMISLPGEKSLLSIKIKSDHTISLLDKIKTKHRCNKIIKYQDNMIAHAYDDTHRFFSVLDHDGSEIHCILKEPREMNGIFHKIRFLAISPDDKILYVTDELHGCIGVSMKGEIVFREAVHRTPNQWGITTDSFGYLFIACYDLNKVVIIDHSGAELKDVISLRGLKPCGISFNKMDRKLFVKKGGTNLVLVFQIK